MLNSNLFKASHKMAKDIKAEYTNIDYKFQFGLCLSYLSKIEGEIKMVELKGSEKQIKWAEEIRKFVTTEIFEAIEKADFTEKNLKKVEAIKKEINNESATYWIETFGFKCVNFEGCQKMFEYLNDKGIAGMKICRKINEKYGF